jgi:tRNA 2-thiouridine synthesizing protein A
MLGFAPGMSAVSGVQDLRVDQPPPLLIDARGHRCPVPTLRLRRALEAMPIGARAILLADDPMARVDVPYFCNEIGYLLIEAREQDQAWAFTVEKRNPSPTA